MTTASGPAMRYYGGKWRLAPWIIANFPSHEHYVEPFGGVASVLIRKPRSKIETYNDLSSQVVTFFRVLRNDVESLIRSIMLTPYSREELRLAHEPATDPIEVARRFWVRCSLTIGASPTQRECSFRSVRKFRSTKELHKQSIQANLMAIAQRFTNVVIENRNALELIKKLDDPQTLFYVDPPYVKRTRHSGCGYHVEMVNSEHEQLIETLLGLRGACVLSGYDDPLYQRLDENGWQRLTRSSNTSGRSRMEILWLNVKTKKPHMV